MFLLACGPTGLNESDKCCHFAGGSTSSKTSFRSSSVSIALGPECLNISGIICVFHNFPRGVVLESETSFTQSLRDSVRPYPSRFNLRTHFLNAIAVFGENCWSSFFFLATLVAVAVDFILSILCINNVSWYIWLHVLADISQYTSSCEVSRFRAFASDIGCWPYITNESFHAPHPAYDIIEECSHCLCAPLGSHSSSLQSFREVVSGCNYVLVTVCGFIERPNCVNLNKTPKQVLGLV